MAYVRQLIDGRTGSVYELAQITTIGRHAQCNIVLDEPTVSAQHAALEQRDDGVWLRDLDSTNGVRHRGDLVEAVRLSDGDRFTVGVINFQFHVQLPSELANTLKIKKSWIPGVYYTK